MASTSTGSGRLDRMNKADADRRRVVTRNGASRSTRPVVIQLPQLPGAGRAKPRRTRRRMRKPGPATIGWGIVAIVLSLVAVILQTVLAITAALLSLLVVVVVAKVEAKKSRSAPPPPPRKRVASPGNGAGARRNGSSGTARPKTPRKPTAGGGKEPVCSDACQVSARPKSTCRCRATECKHGAKAGIGGK
jgi:hypothetical protein